MEREFQYLFQRGDVTLSGGVTLKGPDVLHGHELMSLPWLPGHHVINIKERDSGCWGIEMNGTPASGVASLELVISTVAEALGLLGKSGNRIEQWHQDRVSKMRDRNLVDVYPFVVIGAPSDLSGKNGRPAA